MLHGALLVGLALGLVAVEAAASAAARLHRYALRDTLANLAMAAGGLLFGAAGRAAALPISYALWSASPIALPRAWWVFALLVVAHDLCYYVFHRTSHRVRVFWAAHVAHHSSPHYNLSTALRLSWTTPWTGIPFWWPLPLLGFDPLWILGAHTISLAYQFLLHTEFVGRLGPLEWVLNTPSHHRVHHGCDAHCLDKNFGGIFIVWDRLLGSFAPERARPRYGLVHPLSSHRPWVIAFHEWAALLRACARPGLRWRRRLALLFGRPA
ncbi:MAG: sterol desaturase family protein [Nannocystaceae bacterium]|nr:sterol desaturase family protein [Nannocystaceae bacterium]